MTKVIVCLLITSSQSYGDLRVIAPIQLATEAACRTIIWQVRNDDRLYADHHMKCVQVEVLR